MSGENASEKWTLCELTIGMAILCHFHALASFLQGCGILNDAREHKDSESAENVHEILKKMEDLMSLNEELDLSEVARRFETVKPEDVPLSSRSTTPSQASSQGDPEEIKMVDPTRYTTEMDFQYVDFVKREKPEESPTFREAVSQSNLYTVRARKLCTPS